MHGLFSFPLLSRRSRLRNYSTIIGQMDNAIINEGGPSNLSISDLRRACFIRGLNPINMSTNDLVFWLDSWLNLSSSVPG